METSTVGIDGDAQDVDFQDAARERIIQSGMLLEYIAALIGHQQPVALDFGNAGVVDRPGLELLAESQVLQARALAHRHGLFSIMVFGEFNNGKSTFLNALLGGNTLPTGPVATTAVIQVIQYGSNPNVIVYDLDGQPCEELSWSNFSAEYSLSNDDHVNLGGDPDRQREVVDRFAHVSHAVIERDHPLLNHFVRLIDSPGLGESAVRTRKTEAFFPQADAVLFILDAQHLLRQNEINAIERMARNGDYSHVFFVVNKLNMIRRPADVEAIQQSVRRRLAPYFTDRDGRINEALVNRRVFYVDALAAEAAAEHNDADTLATSGIIGFRRELERFIASPRRVTLELEGDIDLLTTILPRATSAIEDGRQTLLADLEDLKTRKERAEAILSDLREGQPPVVSVSIPAVEQLILQTGEILAGEIYKNLRLQVNDWRAAWHPRDPKLAEVRAAVSVSRRVANLLRHHQTEISQQKLSDATQRYVESQIQEWEAAFPEVFNATISSRRAEQEELVRLVAAGLAHAKSLFTQAHISTDQMTLPEDPAIGIAGLGIGRIGEKLEISGMSSLILKQVASLLMMRLVALVFPATAPFAWVSLFAYMSHAPNSQIDENVNLVGQALFDGLDTQIVEQRQAIRESVISYFRSYASVITAAMQEQIAGLQSQMNQAVAAMESDDTIKAELARIDRIAHALASLGDEVWQVIQERSMTDEERQRLLEGQVDSDGR